MPCCHDATCSSTRSPDTADTKIWRRVLWLALTVNGSFFLGEIVAGIMAGSSSLQADALDFFGDTANYAISLVVVGSVPVWQSRAALLKGSTMLIFAAWVLANTLWHAAYGGVPHAQTMGVVGVAALLANGMIALMLYRYRGGDANRRAVWICSRNDAIGNLAVLLAALGVFGTGTGWPDIIVAAIMGGLGLWGGFQIIRQAASEIGAAVSIKTSQKPIPGPLS